MKTKSALTEPLYLNLYNFDSPSAEESPYILTSPRSLEACRKAGLKPVELLHKSFEEYQEDLGDLNTEKVFQLYTIQEQDRISNLEKCRTIRKNLALLKDNNVLKENARSIKNERPEKHHEPSSRKALLDKENTSRACAASALSNPDSEVNTSTLSSVSVVDHEPEKCDLRKRIVKHSVGGGGDDSLTLEESSSKKPALTCKTTSRNKCNPNNVNKSYETGRYFPSPLTFTSLLPSSEHSSRPTSSVSSLRTLKPRKNTPQPKAKLITRDQSKNSKPCKSHWFSVKRNRVPDTHCNTEDACYKPGRCGKPNRKTSYDSNNNSSISTSITTSTFLRPKKKHVSFSYLSCTDDLCLSEHDRRILESMALKKALERESNEFAYQAHMLWEQDRELREQLNNEQAMQWKEYVTQKRRLENEANSQKWEEMKSSLRKSQLLLEQRIKAKEERAALLKKKIDEQKLCEIEDRSLQAAKRRAEVEAAHQHREIEATVWRRSLDHHQRQRFERAESTRINQRESYRRRVASANRVEELRHEERWKHVREQTESSLRDLKEFCRLRESKVQRKHLQIIQTRDMQLKEQSFEREFKFMQAHNFQEELDRGLEKWQKQVLTLQVKATQRAGYNASKQLEIKRQRVEAENRAREFHHRKLMERVCREDEARLQYIRQLISRKEEKMRKMARDRDLAIQESRIQAQTTSDLREHLRRTLSPETFDRKVARVALEMRISSRPPTASPTMNRSHIFLG